MAKPQPKIKNTSWEPVAEWYGKLLEGEGTYQKDLILPNLLRLMDIKSKDALLDLACGPGFFTREFAKLSDDVTGVDASAALIAMAKDAPVPGAKVQPKYQVAKADDLPFIKKGSIDKAAIVLALQNMENAAAALGECARALKSGGRLFIVLNHPAFRVPKESSWGWDEKAKVQYRRVDRYLSELKAPIEMHPGRKSGPETTSFHRPLQYFFKALAKAGFTVAALEEWNSNKHSQEGPRAKAEDLARKEIPLFLCLVAERR